MLAITYAETIYEKKLIKYVKLSVSIKLFMSCFIAHDYSYGHQLYPSDYCILVIQYGRLISERKTS